MQTIESLNTSISKLEAEVAQLTEKKAHLLTKLQKSDYRKTVKEHITLLHEYNEIRDVGQRKLLGPVVSVSNT